MRNNTNMELHLRWNYECLQLSLWEKTSTTLLSPSPTPAGSRTLTPAPSLTQPSKRRMIMNRFGNVNENVTSPIPQVKAESSYGTVTHIDAQHSHDRLATEGEEVCESASERSMCVFESYICISSLQTKVFHSILIENCCWIEIRVYEEAKWDMKLICNWNFSFIIFWL